MIPPFQLSQADARPMYQQIMDNIKRLILNREWQAGQALPSIRELAVSIKVSVITVKRAYQELEKENIIVTRHGLGSFVAQQSDVLVDQKRAELHALIQRIIELSEILHIDENELLELFKSRFAGEKDN